MCVCMCVIICKRSFLRVTFISHIWFSSSSNFFNQILRISSFCPKKALKNFYYFFRKKWNNDSNMCNEIIYKYVYTLICFGIVKIPDWQNKIKITFTWTKMISNTHTHGGDLSLNEMNFILYFFLNKDFINKTFIYNIIYFIHTLLYHCN